MSQTAKHQDQTDAIRRRTLSTLKTLTEQAKAFELPPPLDALEQCRQKLEDNAYQVLVVGEAKRGKSTFVNALIGHDLLPTDVDIATSQVFRVCPAEREAYRLRFEDDSQMAITAADLARYGSQVLAEAEGVPRLDQIIRWIEVDRPVSFLPANVRILDTPGLGALYAAHAQITHRFVPHADAVIFVLDSQAPFSEPEIKFVEMILEVTQNILFIQTKIDQFRKEAWQEIQKRNEEILRQRFKDRLNDMRVWPISSINLRKAAQTGDEDYLLVSRHKELATALQAFLFRVAGWSRSVQTILLADRYHGESRTALEQRLYNLLEESREKRAEVQRLALERRRQFEADWGERGQKRRDLLEKIKRVSTLGRQSIQQAIRSGGEIEVTQQMEIEQMSSLQAVDEFGKTLPVKVMEAALQNWRRVREQAENQYVQFLVPFLDSVESLSNPSESSKGKPTIGALPAVDLGRYKQDDFYLRLQKAVGYGGAVSGAGYIASAVLVAAGVLTAPLTLPALLPAFIVAGWHGWRSATQSQLKAARQDLSRHLGKLLREVQQKLFGVDQFSGRFSPVDEYFDSRERTLNEQVNKLSSQKLAEAAAEMDRLAEEAKLNHEQRKAKAEQLRKHLADWDGLGQEIKAIQFELHEMDRTWASPATDRA